MDNFSKLNEDSSIKIPEHILKKAGLKPGAEMIWVNDENGYIILMEKPDNFAKAMRGLGKEVWDKVNLDKYIEEERQSWD
ncbi:MAG: hypothetical protein ACTHW2_12280 [Tissierella sp.]|uniref:hypothetical protein n=1 Tax=Tissierella sp. TaxID=41274 RepID=UPI003F954342